MDGRTLFPAIQSAGTIIGGINENQTAGLEAKQLNINAGQQEAASQRTAAIATRQAQIMQSNIRGQAGGSGAGGGDITVQNLEADVGREGEYNALSALYTGKSAANAERNQAALTTYAGKQNLISSVIRAGTQTIAGSGSSMISQYGGDLPPWMANNYGVSNPATT